MVGWQVEKMRETCDAREKGAHAQQPKLPAAAAQRFRPRHSNLVKKPMTEFRRLKMRIGEAEFEADVPENKVQPMYHQFLSMLERRGYALASAAPVSLSGVGADPAFEANVQDAASFEPLGETLDQTSLLRIFDLREDGTLTLRVLPPGPDTNTDALLLLLYGYYRLKNEEYVLATQLFRAAAQSGIALRRSANEYARHSRFVVRGGRRKGSHYSLSSQGLAMARELAARTFG